MKGNEQRRRDDYVSKVKYDGKVFIHIRRGRISEKERIANKVDSIIEQSKYAVTMLHYPKPKKTKVTFKRAEFLIRLFQYNKNPSYN